MWDSLAICEYVSEQYLKGKGWPQAAAARAQARSFAAEMHSGFQALRNAWPLNIKLRRKLVPDAAVQRDIERVCAIWTGCLEKSGGPWLYDEFGIVDAMYAPVALRFWSYQPELPVHAAAYVQTHLANPALKEWMTAGAGDRVHQGRRGGLPVRRTGLELTQAGCAVARASASFFAVLKSVLPEPSFGISVTRK